MHKQSQSPLVKRFSGAAAAPPRRFGSMTKTPLLSSGLGTSSSSQKQLLVPLLSKPDAALSTTDVERGTGANESDEFRELIHALKASAGKSVLARLLVLGRPEKKMMFMAMFCLLVEVACLVGTLTLAEQIMDSADVLKSAPVACSFRTGFVCNATTMSLSCDSNFRSNLTNRVSALGCDEVERFQDQSRKLHIPSNCTCTPLAELGFNYSTVCPGNTEVRAMIDNRNYYGADVASDVLFAAGDDGASSVRADRISPPSSTSSLGISDDAREDRDHSTKPHDHSTKPHSTHAPHTTAPLPAVTQVFPAGGRFAGPVSMTISQPAGFEKSTDTIRYSWDKQTPGHLVPVDGKEYTIPFSVPIGNAYWLSDLPLFSQTITLWVDRKDRLQQHQQGPKTSFDFSFFKQFGVVMLDGGDPKPQTVYQIPVEMTFGKRRVGEELRRLGLIASITYSIDGGANISDISMGESVFVKSVGSHRVWYWQELSFRNGTGVTPGTPRQVAFQSVFEGAASFSCQRDQKVIADATNSKITSQLWFLLLLGIGENGALFFYTLLVRITGGRIVTRFREIVFRELLSKEISFHDSSTPAELVSNMSEAETLMALVENRADTLRDLFVIFGGIAAFLATTKGQLGYIVIGSLILMVAVTIPFQRYIVKRTHETIDEEGHLSDQGFIPIENIRMVRHHGAEALTTRSYRSVCTRLYKISIRVGWVAAFYALGVGYLSSAGLAMSLWRAAEFVVSGKLTTSQLVIFFLYVDVVYDYMDEMFELVEEYNEMVAAAGYLFDFIDDDDENDDDDDDDNDDDGDGDGDDLSATGAGANGGVDADADADHSVDGQMLIPLSFGSARDHRHGPHHHGSKQPKLKPARLTGSITFDNIEFHRRAHHCALKDFNLVVSPRQRVVLIGPKSIGLKRVVPDLLLNFYHPVSGTVRLDDHAVSDLDSRWLHSQIAMLNSGDKLFPGTVRENICCGQVYSEDKIIATCKRLCVFSAIMRLSNGFDTVVGQAESDDEDGGAAVGAADNVCDADHLEDQEAKLLCLTRALIKEPSIVVLDASMLVPGRSTSLLIMMAVSELCSDRTVIVHGEQPVPACADADMIVVLDDTGRTLERGTHAQLIDQRHEHGVYARLQARQVEIGDVASKCLAGRTGAPSQRSSER